MELEGLRPRPEAQKLSDKSVVLDLTFNGIEGFLGRDKIPQWIRELSAALKLFLTANQTATRPPDVGRDVQAQPPPCDALAYRIWATMLRSEGAYQQRYHRRGRPWTSCPGKRPCRKGELPSCTEGSGSLPKRGS